jgi:hypothetical protein
MSRRKFLQNILKVTVLASVPAVVINELVSQPNYPFVSHGNINFSENLISDSDAKWTCDESSHKLENGMIYTDVSIYIEAKEFHLNNTQASKYPFPILVISKDWNRTEKVWLEIQVDDITPEYMELTKTSAPNLYNLIKWNGENS